MSNFGGTLWNEGDRFFDEGGGVRLDDHLPRHNLEIDGGAAEGRVFGREEGRFGLDTLDVTRLRNRLLLWQSVDDLLAVEVRDPG